MGGNITKTQKSTLQPELGVEPLDGFLKEMSLMNSERRESRRKGYSRQREGHVQTGDKRTQTHELRRSKQFSAPRAHNWGMKAGASELTGVWVLF